MAKVKRSIKINAPVEKVFEFVNKPENLVEIWPSLKEVMNIEELPNGGHSFDWTYRMAGLSFEGKTEDIEIIPNERTVSISTGGIQSKVIFEYQSVEGGTIFTDNTDFTIPLPLMGKVAEPLIVKMNERESEAFLANLKARMEE